MDLSFILVWFNNMFGPIGTLVTGAVGGQLLNHFIISAKEKKRRNQESINKFYYPLYEAIKNYFESSTFYRPGDLTTEGRSQYKQREKIISFAENQVDHANNSSISEALYKLKYSSLYEDNSGLQSHDYSHQLMYAILKSYYKVAGKKQKERIKIDILLFQLWMLCINMNLADPDGAMSHKFHFNYKKLAYRYDLNDIEDMISESNIEQKTVFLKTLLKEIVHKDHSEEVNQQFFNPANIWEDSEATSRFFYVIQIIEGTENQDIQLTVSDRHRLRELLLGDIYSSYFYGEKGDNYKYNFTNDQFDALLHERRAAVDYLEEAGLLKVIQKDNKFIVIPTHKGIDEYEINV